MRWLLLVAFGFRCAFSATAAADLGRDLHEAAFDRDQCYRVRDLSIFKEDFRIYLNDGHLIFSKPVAGHRIAAVFETNVEAGDGEVILMPPSRAERTSLAAHLGSPNMDEHFRAAMFLFTGPDYETLMAQLPKNPANKKAPDAAADLDNKWSPVLRNIGNGFETRLALDLLGGSAARGGLFAAMFESQRLGNFDVIFDPHAQEQIVAGSVSMQNGDPIFNTWASYPARPFRRNPPPRHEDLVVSDYRIQSNLNPDLSLDCVTRIKVKATIEGVAAVTFEMAPEMTVSSVTVNGQPAEVLQHGSVRANIGRGGNDLFLVFPPAPLQVGQPYEFEFHHSGKVIEDAGDHVYTVTARGNWYPLHDQQFAQYDLEFRYPADMDLVAAGDIQEDRTEGDKRVTRRRTASPIRFAAFNLGHYVHAHVEAAGYLVDVCANRTLESALKPQPAPTIAVQVTGRNRQPTIVELRSNAPEYSATEGLQSLASGVASSVTFMASRFGPPALPHITVSPIPGNFGQGFPGLIYISTTAYLQDHRIPLNTIAESMQIYYQELLQAHEVAHQWWGNRVTSLTYRDGWLMEALANMSALLYLEHRKGPRPVEVMLETYRTFLLAKGPNGQITDSVGPVTFGPRLNNSQIPGAYRDITYGKGAWILQMLRRRMGDDRFTAMLAELLKRYNYNDISNDEFRRLAVQFLPPKSEDPQLESFFEQWVYGTGIPTLKMSYTVTGKAPFLKVVGTVTQTDVDADFSTLAPIEIQVAHGQTITHWVRTGPDPVSFTVPLTQAPSKVLLDPHFAVLRRQ